MSRRTAGALVLILGLAVAIVVPALLGSPVAGTPQRAPVASAPQVGDCLTAPVVPAGSALVSDRYPVGLARYAPCPAAGDSRRDYGEVVAVVPDAVAGSVDGRASVAGPDTCRQPLRDYLGWTATPWDPVFTDSMSWVGPDAGQYANGQRWIACALTSGRRGYPGTIRDGAFGRAANLFERCEDTGRGTQSRVSCDDPHDVEVFGDALVGPDGQSTLNDSCVALIAARTRMADPTAGGALTIRAGADDPNAVPPDGSANRQVVNCGIRVADDRLLLASLVGIGDRPLPWR